MIKIEVKSADVSTSQRGQYTFHEQTAYAHVFDRDGKPSAYPRQVRLSLNKSDPKPYPVGMYILAPQSLYVGRFDALSLAPVLVPVK